MNLKETEENTELILGRMENSLNSLEQMTLDSINITDKLVMRIDEIRNCMEEMKECEQQDKEVVFDMISALVQDLMNISFEVNNVSHELEKEAVYQHETLDTIKQIVGFLYAMSEV